MDSSNALRVLMVGSIPGEEWLRTRLAQLIPPASLNTAPSLEQADRLARYDLILSVEAEGAIQHWPAALVCEPLVTDANTVRLLPCKTEQRPLVHLIERQLNTPPDPSSQISAERDWQFEILRTVSRVLGSEARASKKLQQVLTTVAQRAGADSATAFLLDRARQYIDIVATSEDGPPPLGCRVTLDSSFIGQLASQSQRSTPVILPPCDAESPDIQLKPGDNKLLPEGWRGIVCIPLVGQSGGIGGILLFYIDRPVEVLGDSQIDLLETIASQTAIVVEDSLLFVAANRRAEQMRLVNEVSREIAAIHDLDVILSIIPDRLTETFGYYHASVGMIGQDGIEMYEAYERSRAIGRDRFRIPLDAKGMVPWVAQAGVGRLANDTHLDEIWVPGKGLEASRSELTVPLTYRDRVIGVIDVQSEHINAFDQDDISVLEALAGQLVIAIENARLYEDSKHQRQIAETLSRISRLAGSMLDVHQVSQTVLGELVELLRFDAAIIALLENDTLRIAHQIGCDTADASSIRWSVEKSPLLYQILRSRELMLIADTADHRLWQKLESVPSIRSWLGAPLLSRGHPIGVLAIACTVPDIYRQQDGELLLTFANQIAVTIDNARLFEKIECREREARTLYEITRSLVSFDQEGIPPNVIDKLGRALPFDVASMLIDGDPVRLVMSARQSVADSVIREVKEHLFDTYNTLSNSQIDPSSVQQRVIWTGPTPESKAIDHLSSRLSAPLLMGRRVIGVIELGKADPTAYTEPELRMLYIIANSTATALENARLYQELMARALNLQQALDELEEADQLKDELVQDISHELRTPLTYIAGYVDLLLIGEMGELQPDQQESLEIVAAKTKTLTRLVEDILSLEKATTENLALSAFQMAVLAEQAAQGIRVASDEAGVCVITEIDHTAGPVMVDPGRISQVFDNLLGNALKFSSPGGAITVRVKQRAQRVRVEIEDTGVGIPQDQLSRIFERFYQVAGPPHRYRGAGLGLTICKQIIEAHGGQIGVTSQEGAGSTFYFELPLANLDAQDAIN